MRKHLTDGLLQIAILLSLQVLSRTHLDEYLNILAGYNSQDYELNDILLGSTSAITQTHSYHNNWDSNLGGYVHPKNIENLISRPLFRDLHILGDYNEIEAPTIATYLVPELDSNTQLPSENANTTSVHESSNDNNNNSPQSTSSRLQFTSQTETPANDILDRPLTEERVGDDLSQEDMDLIEILWRQDIDLGIGKECFDINLRRELEKEQELELKKEEQKKEEKKDEDGQTDASSVNLIIDNETGELIPAREGEQSTGNQTNLTSQQGLSIEEAIEILQEHATSPQPTVTDSGSFVRPPSLSDELSGLLLNLPGVSMSRQVSIEGHWNDVEDLISTTANASVNQPILPITNAASLNGTLLTNVSFASQHTQLTSQFNVTQPLPGNQEALLQNATLGVPHSMDTSELLAVMDPVALGAPTHNDTQPLFNLNNTDTALFPNATISNSTNFLLDLLDENQLDDRDLTFPTPDNLFTPIKAEDHLSDSAVGSLGSTGSTGSLSPYSSDSGTSNLTSPFESNATVGNTSIFDGLEGATGGFEEFLSITKDTKTENEKYDFYPGADDFPPQTDYQYPDQSNSSDTNTSETFLPALQRHIGHNHTYPALPGQEPKERKCDIAARMLKNKLTTGSRDQKKAKKHQLPFSIEEIIHSPVEKFTDMLTKYKLTEPQLQLMKDIRRRGKNKVAAQNCRKRKMEVIDTLEEEVEKMRHERDSLQRTRGVIDKDRNKVRDKYNSLYREVFNSLRDEHGQPYDPNEYTLQHTADGNVFLVPKNNNTDTDHSENKNKRKRHQKK